MPRCIIAGICVWYGWLWIGGMFVCFGCGGACVAEVRRGGARGGS
jgi:hypothetical protein